MPIPKPKGSETEQEFVSRCIGEIYDEYGQEQSAAICYNTYRKAEGMSGDRLVMSKINQFNKYKGINLAEDGDPCWDGYEQYGMKIVDGREIPNCIPVEENMQEVGREIDVLGYKTKNFSVCPGAVALFEHLQKMQLEEDTIGMIRSAAQIADNVFGIEKSVLENKKATEEQLNEAIVLVDDFKDVMEEVDEEVGMRHDVSFMDGHIEVIKSYL